MLTENMGEHILYDGAVVKVEDNIWISLLECNGLVMIDINTGITRFVGCFKNESRIYQLHTKIISYRDKLFFVPWNAENIAIYDLKKNEFRHVSGYKSEGAEYFVTGLVNGKYSYLVSSVSGQVVQVDLESEKVAGRYEMEDDFNEEASYLVPLMKVNDSILKISGRKNNSWVFDLQNKEYKQFEHMFADGAELLAGCEGNECIWIIGDDSILYQLSQNCECMNKYDITEIVHQVIGDNKAELLKCFCFDSVFIISFYDRNCIFKIPLVENIPDIAKCEYMEFDSVFFPDNYDDLIIMLKNRIIIINNDGEKEITFYIDAKFFSDMIAQNNDKLKEIGIYGASLKRYIEHVCGVKTDSLSGCGNANVPIGKKIYDTVKEG